MTSSYDWHSPQADPAGDAEQTAAAYTAAALAVAQARLARRTARARAAAAAAAVAVAVAERALDAARDGYSPQLGAEPVDGPAALAAWRAAAPYADTLPDAATARDRAEVVLRRSSPTAMLRYDTITAAGVDPAQAMRTASIDMPPSAEQPTEAVDPAVRYRAAVHAALDTALADAVLADSSWPALATAIDTAVRDAGTDPVALLTDVAAQRELGTAKNPAAVLRYRIDPRPGPTVADVLDRNYPSAVSDSPPVRRTGPADARRPATAERVSRSRHR